MDKSLSEVIVTMEKRWSLTNHLSFDRGVIAGLKLAISANLDLKSINKAIEKMEKTIEEEKKELEELTGE